MILFLSPHHLRLLFSCNLSVVALLWLVLMVLFCAAIRRDSVSLLRFHFLCHVHDLSSEMSLVSHLKRPLSCSILFLFPTYFRSANSRVLSIVSGGCNQSSSGVFYVAFESLYRCINAVFSTGKSPSSLCS